MKGKPLKQRRIPAMEVTLHPTAAARRARQMREKKAAKESSQKSAEFAEFGYGEIAYIRSMSAEMAAKMYPSALNMPTKGKLYVLNTAMGTALAITDSLDVARGHARGDKLIVVSLH